MFLSKWYRKIKESRDDEFYTKEDSQNRRPNLLNNNLLIPGLLTPVFCAIQIYILVSGSVLYGKVPERHIGLPELPYAGVGHGLERVALLRAIDMPELSFWVICASTVLGGSELVFWFELRYIPYSIIEKWSVASLQ
ncbi:hypothetical protein K505DRAFT_83948 [Melanomma pulvis-pyrius CBS 109.77]|uniref:Uncharacterized protein n=1 Tax=Melanomma pulvis-pyrius CBS 109.77 TaxID=1314802 RepID=A0A6A6X1S5_9PLEO|nr:hypothetical protein K505DRAFT_83948 [Melanomma pulvis-pyrius CBS 109.77]